MPAKSHRRHHVKYFHPETMAAELSVKREDTSGDKMTKNRWTCGYELFTVHVADYKILSVFTDSDYYMKKWVSEVQTRFLKKKKNQDHPLIIGLSVDRELKYGKKGLHDNNYDVLTLCTGTNCLIYSLPDESEYYKVDEKKKIEKKVTPVDKALMDLLANPNVIVVGKDMYEVSEKLEKDYLLKIAKPVDADDYHLMSAKTMKNVTELNMRYVLRDNFRYVTKEEPFKEREYGYEYLHLYRGLDGWKWSDFADRYIKDMDMPRTDYHINRDYVKMQTAGAFLAHLIGDEYLEDIQEIILKPLKK